MSVECGNLKQLIEFAEIVKKLHPHKVKRVKSLTKDTARRL